LDSFGHLEQVEESGSRRPLSRSAAPPLEGPHPGIRWDWRTGDTVKGHQTKVEGICDPKMAMPSSHPPSSLLHGLFDLVGWGLWAGVQFRFRHFRFLIIFQMQVESEDSSCLGVFRMAAAGSVSWRHDKLFVTFFFRLIYGVRCSPAAGLES